MRGDISLFKVIKNGIPCRVFTESGAAESVTAAAADLKRDLKRLSGGNDALAAESSAGAVAVKVAAAPEGPLSHTEGFVIKISDNGVTITGNDDLGAIYGIYAFEEKYLGISPFCRMNDIFPKAKTDLEIENGSHSDYPKTYRFRGWFINDEDLLCEFRDSGGKRGIDYYFYDDVMDVSVLEMVLETALRLRMNLIIPGTLLNIDNEPEERLVAAAARRGLWVSQHHLENVGLSYFAAEKYIKKYRTPDMNNEISFVTNRELMIEMWRHYITKWAKYPKVIWQLGIRGRGDKPVWYDDPNIEDTHEAHAAVIQDAIDTQVKLITEITGNDDFISTQTLWCESALLYGLGLLKIPKESAVIFADVSFNQMLSDDFFTFDRSGEDTSEKRGLYYHSAYIPDGPHLCEGNNPYKMYYNYSLSVGKGDTYYSVINVGNVREFGLSVYNNSRITWDYNGFDPAATTEEYFVSTFGVVGKKIAEIYKRYFRAFPVMSEEFLRQTYETPYGDVRNKGCSNYHFYDDLPDTFDNYVLEDGVPVNIIRTLIVNRTFSDVPDYRAKFAKSAEKMKTILADFEALRGEIKEGTADFYDFAVLLPCKFLINIWSAAVEMSEAFDLFKQDKLSDALFKFERGRVYIMNILEARWAGRRGIWYHWYRGDKKFNMEYLLVQLDYFIKEEILGIDKKR